MKLRFDSTGTLGTLYETAIVIVVISATLFLSLIRSEFSPAVSAIILIVSAVAAVILLNRGDICQK